MQKIYRIGPILLILPVAVWALAWFFALSEENQAWYIVWPLEGLLGLAIIWHVALLVTESARVAYFVYALFHLPVFCGIFFLALVLATRFPL